MTLHDRIYAYFKAQPMVWVPSAHVEKLVMQNTKYIASNGSRQCRQLAEEGLLEREEYPYKGKRLAWYRYNPQQNIQILSAQAVAWFNALPCCPLRCIGGANDPRLCKAVHPNPEILRPKARKRF